MSEISNFVHICKSLLQLLMLFQIQKDRAALKLLISIIFSKPFEKQILFILKWYIFSLSFSFWITSISLKIQPQTFSMGQTILTKILDTPVLQIYRYILESHWHYLQSEQVDWRMEHTSQQYFLSLLSFCYFMIIIYKITNFVILKQAVSTYHIFLFILCYIFQLHKVHFLLFKFINQYIQQQTQQMNYLPVSTILAKNNEQSEIHADHPLFYTRERTHYLQRLTRQVNAETDLPTVDLRRNMRIDHYLNQYNQVRGQQERQIKIKNTLLNTQQFNSIFQEDEQKRRQQQNNTKKMKSIQEQLYKNYIEEVNLYVPPERDTSNFGKNEPVTILSLGDSNKMKQLYLLDLQIGKLKQEEQLQKVVKDRRQSCQNNALLSKMSSTIISGYMVYFDEIYQLLIDQLLEDEVIYLNHLEANFKVNKSLNYPQNPLETRQTLQMMDLVKSLDDLCDE